jgi:pilus assembly protein FimV
MLRRSALAVAVALALLPATGHGLGLGQIRSSSALNQPFEGEIDLQSVSADELGQVKVRLAAPDAFARAGLELTGPLGKLKFEPYVRPNGQPAIRVSSQEAVREPFLDFLVEVEWPQGKTVKEYTVLLDPPTFTERRVARVKPAEIERAPAQAQAPRGQPPPARAVAPAAPAAAPVPAPAPGGEEYGPVRRGETLWSIADRTKPAGVTTQQAVNAIYAANPQAFIRGDVNKLKAGAGLRLPTPQEMGSIDVQTARRELLEKVKEPAREGPARAPAAAPAGGAAARESADRLRLLAPLAAETPAATAPAVTAPAAAPAALRQDLLLAQEKAESALQTAEQLQGRVADMERQLRDMQRLVLLKDEQLAQLQRHVGTAGPSPVSVPGQGTAPTSTPVAATPAEPVVTASPVSPPVAESAPDATPVPAGPAPGETPVAAAAPPAPSVTTAPEVPAVGAPEQVKPTGAAASAPAEPPEVAPVTASTEKVPAVPPPPAAAPAPAPEAAPLAVPAPAPVAAPAERPARGALATVLNDPASLVGIGVAGVSVLAALLWAIAGRRRKGGAGAEGEVAGGAAETAPVTLAATASAVAPSPPPAEGKAARMEPLAAAAAVAGATVAGAGLAPTAEAPERERVPTEDLAALELSTTDLFGLKGETTEVDPTEEADVYIAYGRYEQAEQLLRLALEMEPHRLALKHKLLEVYFGSRDASAFGALFREMKAAGAEAEDSAGWQRALRMGRQLSPGDPTFSGAPADDLELEAALREAERGLAADLGETEPDLGPLKVDTRFSEAAPDLDGGSVLNDLSLDLGTEDLTDKASHPFKLDVTEEVSELGAGPSIAGDLDDTDFAKGGDLAAGFSLDELTGKDIDEAHERAPDLSGIDWAPTMGGLDQDTTLTHADTTLELVDDVETKLDLARAYIELGDGEGARVMLQEVLDEGNDAQKASAQAMLKELA